MGNPNEQLTIEVMRRIHRVYFWRAFIRPFALECAALAALIGTSAFLVSLRNVLGNAYSTHSLSAEAKYLGSALMNTELSVKVLFVGAVMLVGLILRDVAFGISRAAGRVRAAFS